MATSDTERGLRRLEAELKRLEAEYNMYFAGRLPTPPLKTRHRVEALVKQYDRAVLPNYGDRFRFQTLQSRFITFIDLWDRGLRAREGGRSGPFGPERTARSTQEVPGGRVLCVATFRDPLQETDKLQALYDSLSRARRESGETPVPFHAFVDLVKDKVAKMQSSGSPEVSFRVALENGRVNLTAQAIKGPTEA